MRLPFILSLFLAVTPALAQPVLRLPLSCTLGEDCFLQNYVDVDPGPGAADWTGGPLSYDGHKGTDLRLTDLAAMEAGVPVLAPAAGTVVAARDGMPDVEMVEGTDLGGRDCGNGIVIDHGDGWETQLCHLRRGSVLAAEGSAVAAGDVVGQVGLSGATQFPHVHLSARHDGDVVDPFQADLWDTTPPYEPGGLMAAGFADGVPDYTAVKAGTAAAGALSNDGPALVIWASVFGGRDGDVIRLTFEDPDGAEAFAADIPLDRDQAQLFRAAGRRTPPGGWPAGRYAGLATLIRDGQEIDRIETGVTMR